jgi:Kdo2-lipid IVA lauroyltransferase/acyltransferase
VTSSHEEKNTDALENSYPWSPDKIHAYAQAHTTRNRPVGHRLLRAVVWFWSGLIRTMSARVAYTVGGGVGRLLHRLRVRRDVAIANLDIVYGDTKTAAEKDGIYRDSLINFGRQVLNYLRIPHLDETFWRDNFALENEHILNEAYNRGKGVIFLYMHFGPWELPGGKISSAGYPLAVVAKRVKNPVVDNFVVDARLRMNLGTIGHKNSMPRIKQGLADGEGVIMVIDQNMKRSQGVFVDWLGHQASTVRSVAWLARETGAPVITGFALQTGPDRFKMTMTEIIDWLPDDDPETELIRNTQNYADTLGKRILEHPEQWFWLHRRWKVQPEGTANPYNKTS